MKDQAAPPTFHDLSSFVTFRIARVQNTLNAHAIATLAAQSDLTLTEWRMLASIESRKQTTAAEIVRHTQIDKAQVSRAIKSLRARNLIIASENLEDHRQQTLSLSDAGRSVFEKLVVVMRQRQAMLTQDIEEDEIKVLFSILERLAARAEQAALKD